MMLVIAHELAPNEAQVQFSWVTSKNMTKKLSKLRGRLRAESRSMLQAPFFSERPVPASITWSQLSFPTLGHPGDAHFPDRAFPAWTWSWQRLDFTKSAKCWYAELQPPWPHSRRGDPLEWRYLQHVSVCLYSGNHSETFPSVTEVPRFPGAELAAASRVEVAGRISPTVTVTTCDDPEEPLCQVGASQSIQEKVREQLATRSFPSSYQCCRGTRIDVPIRTRRRKVNVTVCAPIMPFVSNWRETNSHAM